MSSIVNFQENLKDRKSDVILASLNRLYDAKISGVMSQDELSRIVVLAGDLYANKISKGEVSKSDIEETESLISGFIEPNYDGYFNFPHSDLDKAAKIFMNEDFFALERYEERNLSSSPLFDEETYSRGFKSL